MNLKYLALISKQGEACDCDTVRIIKFDGKTQALASIIVLCSLTIMSLL